jgi:hypothetical protein
MKKEEEEKEATDLIGRREMATDSQMRRINAD